MAQRRMFSLLVTDTDTFLDMPLSTQALYFHLGMHGDDEGFVGSPKRIARSIGCNADDLKVLAAKGFIIVFESGVVVIRDWNVNNTLQNDRFHKSIYTEERAQLSLTKGKRYEFASVMESACIQDGSNMDTGCIQNDSRMEPELNITKPNITKQRIYNSPTKTKPETVERSKPRQKRFIPPTIEEVEAYIREKGYNVDAERFIAHYESNGWMVGKSPMKSWKAALVTWKKNSFDNQGKRQSTNGFLDILREMDEKEGATSSEQEADSTSPFDFESGVSELLPWNG